MALDDKVFQSAIAKINKNKLRQSSAVPQVHVFEDPPHLRKQENETTHVIIQPVFSDEVKSEIILENLLNTQHEPSIIEQIISHDENNKKGTEQGTNHGTKRVQNMKIGYIIMIQKMIQIVVQKSVQKIGTM